MRSAAAFAALAVAVLLGGRADAEPQLEIIRARSAEKAKAERVVALKVATLLDTLLAAEPTDAADVEVARGLDARPARTPLVWGVGLESLGAYRAGDVGSQAGVGVGGTLSFALGAWSLADPRGGAEPGPERGAEVRQHLERLYEHLEYLKPKQRIAFVLHVVYDHPLSEVAALMGASKAATKSRVFWARRTLLARVRRDPELRELLGSGEVR